MLSWKLIYLWQISKHEKTLTANYRQNFKSCALNVVPFLFSYRPCFYNQGCYDVNCTNQWRHIRFCIRTGFIYENFKTWENSHFLITDNFYDQFSDCSFFSVLVFVYAKILQSGMLWRSLPIPIILKRKMINVYNYVARIFPH